MERAREIRAIETPHHNCAQSVLMTFSKSLKMDDETAYKLCAAFGSGMKSGITCGAVTGALMVLGLFGLESPEETQKLIKTFREKHADMINCSDLLRANAAAGAQPRKCPWVIAAASAPILEIYWASTPRSLKYRPIGATRITPPQPLL